MKTDPQSLVLSRLLWILNIFLALVLLLIIQLITVLILDWSFVAKQTFIGLVLGFDLVEEGLLRLKYLLICKLITSLLLFRNKISDGFICEELIGIWLRQGFDVILQVFITLILVWKLVILAAKIRIVLLPKNLRAFLVWLNAFK